MPSLTIKNIPRETYKALKRNAESHHRSLNSEIINCLEKSVKSRVRDTETLIQEMRTLRRKIRLQVTESDLKKFKNEGRS